MSQLKYLNKLMGTITEYGHAVQYVADNPPFAYTVGRANRGRPELVMVGALSPDTLQGILNALAAVDDESERPLEAGQLVGEILQDYDVKVVEADPRACKMYIATTLFGDDIEGLQILWPDKWGLFPGEIGCTLPRDAQTIRQDEENA